MKLRKIVFSLALAATAMVFTACNPTLKDADGNSYKSVKIGDQIWQASNMNVRTDSSWCYDNKPENCDKYGRLYSWEDAQKVCPAGWHLPTGEDFTTFLEYLGADSKGNAESIKIRVKEWDNGTDDYGLSVLPAGYREIDGNYQNHIVGWWSATEYSYSRAYRLRMKNGRAEQTTILKLTGYSVRCLKD